MSQRSQQSEGSKIAREESYREARRRAKAAAEHDVTTALDACQHPDNLLLVHFLQEARENCRKEGVETFAKALYRGARELRKHSLRVYDTQGLSAVPGIGPAIVKVVEKHFWSDPDCKPYAADAAEKEVEKRHYEDRGRQELAKKESVKKQRAEERAQQKRLNETAAQLAASQSQVRQPSKKAAKAQLASEQDTEEEGAGRGKKRQKKATKEYMPGVGTANYAFMLVLFQAQRSEEPFLLKHDLMNRAENLHITNKPIKGNPNQGNGQYTYDGWSSFSSLTNRQPPLCQAYSNPKRCRLTPEGEVLARRLYRDAVERQLIPPDPAIMEYLQRTESHAQASGSQEHTVRAIQGSTLAARAPIGGSLDSRQLNDDMLPDRGPIRAAQGHLQVGDLEATAAKGTTIVRDADIACLMEMGFTPEQATKGLAGGRSVAEAVQVIAIDSDSDLDSEPLAPVHTVASLDQSTCGASNVAARAAGPACVGTSWQHYTGGSMSARAPYPGMPSSSAAAVRSSAPALGAGESAAAATAAAPHSWSQAIVGRQPIAGPSQAASQALGFGASGPQLWGRGVGSRAGDARQGAGPAASGQGQTQHSTGPATQASQGHTLAGRGKQGLWRLPVICAEGCFSPEERDIRLPPLPPGATFADMYEVVLILDTREQFGRHMARGGSTTSHAEAVQQLTNLGIKVMSKSLEGGDAMWCAQPRAGGPLYTLDTVVERKRVDDLVSSIKDARYERQKYFLHRCGLRRIMYLLEGDIDLNSSSSQGAMNKACKTAMLQTEVVDGFQVLRTPDCQATFRLYQRITIALQEKYGGLRADSPQVAQGGHPSMALADLDAHLLRAKKVTLRDVWGLMLTTIPGVGPEITEAILRVYATPISLWKAYDAAIHGALATGGNATAAANNLLVGLPISASRRITPMLSARAFSSLFANGWQVA